MVAVDEVVSALTGQQQAALERLEAVGDARSGGEYAHAVQLLNSLHSELRKVENVLDPARPEAVQDRLLENLQEALAGNLQRIAEEQDPARQHTNQTIVRG